MGPVQLAILFAVVGIVLLIGELLLPTGGVLGVLGLVAVAVAIGACFFVNQWLGVGVLVGAVVAAPFVATAAINIWPRTPVGRRILLPDVESRLTPSPVALGQTGHAVSELRPMGEVEFDGRRLEAISEHGIIPAGSRVKVVALASDKPTVRLVTS